MASYRPRLLRKEDLDQDTAEYKLMEETAELTERNPKTGSSPAKGDSEENTSKRIKARMLLGGKLRKYGYKKIGPKINRFIPENQDDDISGFTPETLAERAYAKIKKEERSKKPDSKSKLNNDGIKPNSNGPKVKGKYYYYDMLHVEDRFIEALSGIDGSDLGREDVRNQPEEENPLSKRYEQVEQAIQAGQPVPRRPDRHGGQSALRRAGKL